MNIYIKDMKMPENCGDCPCYYDGYCKAKYEDVGEGHVEVEYSEYKVTRAEWCPLIASGDVIEKGKYKCVVEEMNKLADMIIKIKNIVN